VSVSDGLRASGFEAARGLGAWEAADLGDTLE